MFRRFFSEKMISDLVLSCNGMGYGNGRDTEAGKSFGGLLDFRRTCNLRNSPQGQTHPLQVAVHSLPWATREGWAVRSLVLGDMVVDWLVDGLVTWK